ncbi:MAG TPA: metalloregulator ArsR/SmtB family transcription factor [Ktedonobacteraceae bacterium]|jgi:DNA-binding transcriptional ArsR family regulator
MPVSSLPDECVPARTRRRRSVHPEYALTVRRGLLPADTASRVASLFAILADPTRLQVVYALLNAPDGELCVGDLAAGLGRDDTTISHQLRVLRSNHVVAIRKAGRVVYYRLVDEHIRQVLSLGLTHARESQLPSSQASEVVSV